MTLSASAAGTFQVNRPVQKNLLAKQTVKAERLKDKKMANQPERVITEQPEGELKTYERTGEYIYPSGQSLYIGAQSGKVKMIYAADGETVYIQNIVAGSGAYYGDAWVEGKLSDGGTKMTVAMGQSIYYSTQYDADVVLCWGATGVENDAEGNPTITFTEDAEVTEAVYTIDPEAGTFTLEGTNGDMNAEFPNNYVATGLTLKWTDDNSFGSCIEWNTVLSQIENVIAPEVITEQPEGELVTYLRSGGSIFSSFFGLMTGEQSGKARIVYAPDGETVYLQTPVSNTYDSWVKGTINGNKITVPLGQFASWNEDAEYGTILSWITTSVVEGEPDENGDPTYSLQFTVEDRENATFTIDEAAGTITLDDSYGDVTAEFPNNYIGNGLGLIWSDDLSFYQVDFSTVYTYLPPATPAVPAAPTIDEDATVAFEDSGDEEGMSRLTFAMPTTDVDGNPIDEEFLSYSVYIDNETEPFTFTAAEYSYDLTEDATEIPYALYSNGYDFYPYRIYFYRTNMNENPLFTERIGVQAIYTVDGERNVSEIAWSYLVTNGIDNVKAGTAADGPIYNLMGQKMTGNLPAGIYIQNGKKFIVK